jgi:RNA polymerase sigma factor (TIGR02999 family)
MRRVLIDHARSRGALKRGGGCIRVPLDAVELMNSVDTEQIVALEEVVSRLEKQDAELGEIVRLRFYAGLTSEQAAEVMSLPLRTFKRRWSLARGFLMREIERAREELAHDAG